MANWFTNTVEIKGEESKVKEFVDSFLKNGISAFYPTPKEWDVVDVTELEGNVGYSLMLFETPWSPSIEEFEKLAELFPTFTFLLEYTESGSRFFRHVVFKDGKLDEDHNYDWEDRFEDGWWLHKRRSKRNH